MKPIELGSEIRQNHFQGLLRGPAAVNERNPRSGLVYIIPTNRSSSSPTINISLESIADQGMSAVSRRVVVADNGITADCGRGIKEKGLALGLDIEIVDATARGGAGHARNEAVNYVSEQGRNHPQLRPEFLIFADDDIMLGPKTEAELVRTAVNTHAGAVSSRSIMIPATNLAGYYELRAGEQPVTNGQVIKIPSLVTSDGVDMVAIASFGGLVIAKSNYMLMDAARVEGIIQGSKTLFVQHPGNSMEDAIATVFLQKNGGAVYQNPNAYVWDMQREEQKDMLRQQSSWALDYVVALADLRAVGMARPGIRILEPKGDHWEEVVIPSEKTGVIINPSELKKAKRHLRELLRRGKLDFIPEGLTENDVSEGLVTLDHILEFIDRNRRSATVYSRTDLPRAVSLDTNLPRHRLEEGGIARLMGCIKGVAVVNDLQVGKLPPVFLYGLRQGGEW